MVPKKQSDVVVSRVLGKYDDPQIWGITNIADTKRIQTRDLHPCLAGLRQTTGNRSRSGQESHCGANLRPNAGPKVIPAATRLRHERRSQRPSAQQPRAVRHVI